MPHKLTRKILIISFTLLCSLAPGPARADQVDDLIQRLDAPKIWVRRQAIQNLGSLGKTAERAADRLVQIAQDKNSNLRGSAVYSLGQIQSRSPQVIWALADIADADDNSDLRKQAIRALQELGPDSIPALTKLLRNKDFSVFQEAARSLEGMGSDVNLSDISPYLESIADDPRRGPAARRLLKIFPETSGSSPSRPRPDEVKKEEKKSGEYKYIYITPSDNPKPNQ